MPALNVGADPVARSALFVLDANGNPAALSVLKINAGFLAPGQTAKPFVGKQITSTTVTTTVPLATVTAGKTLYFTDIVIATDAASGAATTVDVRLQGAGLDIFRGACHNLAPISAPGIETQPFATTGQAVTLLLPITNPAVNVWFNLFGFEQ